MKVSALPDIYKVSALPDMFKCSDKNELDTTYDHITDDIRIRSKCDWYEHSEKSTKFFLNLEKQRLAEIIIKKLNVNDK